LEKFLEPIGSSEKKVRLINGANQPRFSIIHRIEVAQPACFDDDPFDEEDRSESLL
jgi:hypothetical protein